MYRLHVLMSTGYTDQTQMSAIKDLKTPIEFTQANLEEVETSVDL